MKQAILLGLIISIWESYLYNNYNINDININYENRQLEKTQNKKRKIDRIFPTIRISF